MNKEYRLTEEGVAELKAELEELISKRKEVAENIKTAREFGDLSENAEYQNARETQNQQESRIAEIEMILKNVKLISDPTNNDIVELGNSVVLSGNGDDKLLTIVGSVEADPAQSKISDESPLGQAVLGKKIGETVEIQAPAGTTVYTIKKIT